MTRPGWGQVMVRLAPDTLAQLKADAESNERTVSQTVRLALKQFFARERS